MSRVVENCKDVLRRIEAAKQRSGRKLDLVSCVCVSKNQPVELIQELISAKLFLGGTILGENYVQEWSDKKSQLSGDYKAHLTGSLQSNKINRALQIFDYIQTVGSLRLAEKLSQAASKAERIIPVFIQINISNDASKHGFNPQDLVSHNWNVLLNLKNIDIQGLMTITRFYENTENVRPDFKAMRQLRQQLGHTSSTLKLNMGMSADFEIAIEEGADVVRVGTAIFGER